MRSLLRNSLFVAAGYAAWSASVLPSAHACSFAAPPEHLLDPGEEAADTTPPGAPVLGAPQFSRHPDLPRCGNPSSCVGSGAIRIVLSAPADDRTPGAEMGYVFEVTGGTLPTNLSLPETPVRATSDGGISFLFSDDDQSIDVTLSVRAMDLGGNLGAPATVRVTHPGKVGCVGGPGNDAGGCSAGARAGLGAAAMVLLALAITLHRRKESHA